MHPAVGAGGRTRRASRLIKFSLLALACAGTLIVTGAGGLRATERERAEEKLPPFSADHIVVPGASPDTVTNPPAGGTWTQLTNLPSVPMDNCLVLTDGDVFCHEHRSTRWHRLKPSNTGSYQAGTWSFDSSMPTGYAPLYFASAVLADGRVIVAGGEYNCNPGCISNWQAKAAFYNPATRTWVNVPPPTGWTTIGDAQGNVMFDGRFHLADCCSAKMAYFNPATLTWSAITPSVQQADNYNNEENWVLLPNGRLLAVDAWHSTQTYSETFDPLTLQWAPAGNTKVVLTDPGSKEQGPGVLRPDGTVVFFGGADPGPGHTAVYDYRTANIANAWIAGADFPNFDTASDSPAAVLPNGNILTQASPGVFNTPSSWYEYDGTNTFTRVTSPNYSFSPSSYEGQMLVLPTGQVLQTEFSNDIRLYTPTGTYDPAWAPAISTFPATIAPGGTGYGISGTQFNGVTQGGYYGDDWQSATNYPLVRIRNNATGHVFYAKTYGHSSMGVQTGSLLVNTTFDVPAGVETGPSTLSVVASGIPSPSVAVTVQGAGTLPGAFAKASPPDASTGHPTSLTLAWATSAGASSYEYCIDTTGDSACGTSWVGTGGATAATVSGLVAGTTYYWQARATNGAGTTVADSGTWWSFTTAVTQPGPFNKTSPANAASGLSGTVALTWGASTNATSYTYCVDTTNDNACGTQWVGVGAATSANFTGLTAGSTYYWQVRATNVGGTVDANTGTWWSFTALSAPAAFGKVAPANGGTVSATAQLTLSWNASSGATSYEFCIDMVNDNACGGTWRNMGTALSRTIQDVGNRTFYWQVRAVNGAGTTVADSGTWWSFTGGSAAPGAFAKLLPANGTTGVPTSLTLTWGASTGASGYEYCVDTTNDNACGTTWIGAGGTSAGIAGLTAGLTYYWQVRATNTNGTTIADGGAWWMFATGTSAPGPFTKSTPTNGATGLGTSLNLGWTTSAGAASYQYCVDTTNDSACGTTWVAAGGTSAALSGLTAGTTYYWQVRATSGGGTTNADNGTWWSFSTVQGAPGNFTKIGPANGATVSATAPLTMSWNPSIGAVTYEFCIDQVNDNVCGGTWRNMGTALSRTIQDIGSRTFYWQVRAVNPGGTTTADGGTWFRFTGAPPQTTGQQ
ncbi:MAG: hypothetical protein AB7H96_11140 [Vicinamibacterales bacterium]